MLLCAEAAFLFEPICEHAAKLVRSYFTKNKIMLGRISLRDCGASNSLKDRPRISFFWGSCCGRRGPISGVALIPWRGGTSRQGIRAARKAVWGFGCSLGRPAHIVEGLWGKQFFKRSSEDLLFRRRPREQPRMGQTETRRRLLPGPESVAFWPIVPTTQRRHGTCRA